MNGRGLLLAIVGGVAAAALAPASAGAVVTVGNDLQTEPITGFCGNPCTAAIAALPAADQAPGGAQISSSGVIVRWRLRTGPGVEPVRTRLRVVAGNTSAGESSEVTLPKEAGIYAFDARVPVQPGQRLGVDLINPDADLGVPIGRQAVPGADTLFWAPTPLGTGETRPPTTPSNPQLELFVNADVEPDADADGYGDETQDTCLGSPERLSPCGAPRVAFEKQPKRRTQKRKAKFRFIADDPAATFECSLDGAAFEPCASPLKQRVKLGRHKLAVRAIDADGTVSEKPAKAKWRVR